MTDFGCPRSLSVCGPALHPVSKGVRIGRVVHHVGKKISSESQNPASDKSVMIFPPCILKAEDQPGDLTNLQSLESTRDFSRNGIKSYAAHRKVSRS